MKMVTAIIQPKRLDSVRQALSEINVTALQQLKLKVLADKKAILNFIVERNL